MKHGTQAVPGENASDAPRTFSTLTIERAKSTLAALELLFSELDCLRLAAETSGDTAVIGETRITKERIAESYALPWLRGISMSKPRKSTPTRKRKP